MQTVVIKTQAEFDALPAGFAEYIVIEIRSNPDGPRIQITRVPGSSHVVARGSSHVVARGSSHVEAWESSHVEAWESSHVVARGQSTTHQRSTSKNSEIHGQAVCYLYDGAGVPLRKSDNATIIQVQNPKGVTGWLEAEGVVEASGKVILYKRVSKDFRTQEGQTWETTWVVGEVVSHPAWAPVQECGGGQFHACSRPYFCDEFRSTAGDLYIAIEIKLADLHAHEYRSYPHKISFREGVVLHEVDRYGEKLAGAVEVAV